MKRIFAILFSLAFAFNVYAADIKISELPVVTSVTPATDVVPVVASGATSQVTVTNLMKGANAGTATALAADPANCAAGQIALGVTAAGVAECTATPSVTTLTGAVTGTASGNIANTLLDATGSMVYASGANTPAKLAAGTAGYVLKMGASIPEWSNSLSVTIDDSAAQFTSATASKGTRKLVQSSIDNGILLTDTPVITGNVTWTNISQGAGTYTRVFEEALNVFTVKQEFDATAGLQVGSTGVLITSDNDGAITFLGASGGYDEDLTLNLDDTENTAVISSSTGVTKVDFSALNLVTKGTIAGGIPIVTKNADGANTFTGDEFRGALVLLGHADAISDITLPDYDAAGSADHAKIGDSVCFYAFSAYAHTIHPAADDKIRTSNGTLNGAGAGVTYTTASTPIGGFVCFVLTDSASDVGHWSQLGMNGTWPIH